MVFSVAGGKGAVSLPRVASRVGVEGLVVGWVSRVEMGVASSEVGAVDLASLGLFLGFLGGRLLRCGRASLGVT